MQIIGLISSKRGKLHFKLIAAAALLLAAIYSFTAFAENAESGFSEANGSLTNESAVTARQDLSGWNSNTVQLSDGKLRTEFSGGWLNYLAEDDSWKPIRYEFEETEGGWVAKDDNIKEEIA